MAHIVNRLHLNLGALGSNPCSDNLKIGKKYTQPILQYLLCVFGDRTEEPNS